MTPHEEYVYHLKRVQTGVATLQQHGLSNETEPKHLRVGVNSALLDSAAIAELLMSKGIFTLDELYVVLARKTREEADKYEARCKQLIDPRIVLGPAGEIPPTGPSLN